MRAATRRAQPPLTRQIGVDTNYVAAMERAAVHLPADAVRPTLVLFTDGKHDVAGVPVSEVQPARDRLFGSRSPFALLPVGMGIAAADRAALSAGLERLRITKDMPACVDGATFDWPQVVFESADEAGAAVAVALAGRPRAIDLGRVVFRAWDGRESEAVFANVASAGMSGISLCIRSRITAFTAFIPAAVIDSIGSSDAVRSRLRETGDGRGTISALMSRPACRGQPCAWQARKAC